MGPFGPPKSISGAPGDEKGDLKKPLFYLSKTILFNLGGPPGTPKIDLRTASEVRCEFPQIFTPKATPKSTQNGPKMESKRHQKSNKNLIDKSIKKLLKNKPKMESRGGPGEPWGSPGGAQDPPWPPQGPPKDPQSSPRPPLGSPRGHPRPSPSQKATNKS